MFEIDKEKLGAFIVQLRKEKGYTQKELADKLFVSNKAVSKWETGSSIPDTTLLIPLADILGVSVTELLTYRRMAPNTALDCEHVENLMKATITYTEEEQLKLFQNRKHWIISYFACLIVCMIEIVLLYLSNPEGTSHLIFTIMAVFFGGYFCLFAKPKLPTYYDENKINIYSDGPFRMNIPGVSFNNSNWPHILRAIRIWALASMTGYPVLGLIFTYVFPESMLLAGTYSLIALYILGLFLPIYVVGRKYQ